MMTFVERVHALNAHAEQLRRDGESDPRFGITRSKAGNRELCRTLGVPCAELYHEVMRCELRQEHLRRPCVLKPTRGAAGIGCMVLDVVGAGAGAGAWLNIKTGHRLGLDDIRSTMDRVSEQRAWWGDGWTVEELLRPAHADSLAPFEYMVFVFGGRPELTVGRRSQSGQTISRWFSADWEETDIGRGAAGLNPDVPLPTDPTAISAMASRVARAVPFDFARVDLYDTSRGVVVGEINDHTGGLQFSAEWDARLGEAWARGERNRKRRERRRTRKA